MICKKCGGEMRLWLLRPEFKSFACQSCEFVAIAREESPSPIEQPPRDNVAGVRS
jgi:hypothetical protein